MRANNAENETGADTHATSDTLITTPPMGLEPGWIDYNDHLNMAYYNVLFDRAVDIVYERIGAGPAYLKAHQASLFTVETHIRYLRELKPDALVTTTFQLIAHDDKRLHGYQEVRHRDGWLAATCEGLFLHVDQTVPRASPFPPLFLPRSGSS